MKRTDPLQPEYPGTAGEREQRRGIAALRDQAVITLGAFPPAEACDLLHMINSIAAAWLYVPAIEDRLRSVRLGCYYLVKAADAFAAAYAEGDDG